MVFSTKCGRTQQEKSETVPDDEKGKGRTGADYGRGAQEVLKKGVQKCEKKEKEKSP